MANILAVDDSQSMRTMVSYTLADAGHKVVISEDGEQGLKAAQETPFNLVITDIHMPIMDGFTLLDKLRALPHYKFVPILVLTTESGLEQKVRGKNAGATGWIVKPFDPDQLLAVVARVLDPI